MKVKSQDSRSGKSKVAFFKVESQICKSRFWKCPSRPPYLIIPPRVHPCAHAHYAIKQYLVNDNASYSHYCVFADPGLQWLRCCCSAISSFVQWAYSRTACSSVFPCRLQLQANSHVSVYCSYTESCCLLNSSGEC